MVLGGCFWHGRMKLNGKKQSKNFFKIKDYGNIIKNGLPSLCRQGFASVAAVLLNRQAVGYGDAAVAAMSVDGRLFKAGIYFYFMEQHHSGGRTRSGRIPFRTDDHELLFKRGYGSTNRHFYFSKPVPDSSADSDRNFK